MLAIFENTYNFFPPVFLGSILLPGYISILAGYSFR